MKDENGTPATENTEATEKFAASGLIVDPSYFVLLPSAFCLCGRLRPFQDTDQRNPNPSISVRFPFPCLTASHEPVYRAKSKSQRWPMSQNEACNPTGRVDSDWQVAGRAVCYGQVVYGTQ